MYEHTTFPNLSGRATPLLFSRAIENNGNPKIQGGEFWYGPDETGV